MNDVDFKVQSKHQTYFFFALAWFALALTSCSPTHCRFPAEENPLDRKTIYVTSHGWHTGIIIQQQDISPELWPESSLFAENPYLEIGWGDKDFYRASEITSLVTLDAAFLPSPGVLHIVGFNEPVVDFFNQSKIVQVQISGEGFNKLCAYISKSYKKDKSGETTDLGPGLYGESRFYRSKEFYYLPKTCNVWTARALREAGCPMISFLSLTAGSILYQAKRFGEVIR